MTDQNKNTSPDDEYQFPQDEYATSNEAKPEAEVNSAAAPEKSSQSGIKNFLHRLPPIKNKRIAIVVAAVVMLFVVFHFVNKAKTPAPAVAPAPEVVQKPSDNAVMGSLGSIGASASRNEAQIQNLRAQLSTMQDSLSQTQTENQVLQKSVADLTAQMQILSGQLEKALSSLHAPVKGKRIVFHLRAVLPDRAWITSNTGETISVTTGDHVNQYGTIQAIDARNGIVTTSSGRKIEYGPNDY